MVKYATSEGEEEAVMSMEEKEVVVMSLEEYLGLLDAAKKADPATRDGVA